MVVQVDYIDISKKKSTKIKKAIFLFFDWVLPDYNWGFVGKLSNKIRILLARTISKEIAWSVTLRKGSDVYPGLSIGENVWVGKCVSFDWGVTIGSGTRIGKYTSFNSQNFMRNSEKGIYEGLTKVDPITIGENCWIGEKAIIMRGVSIGKFSTVGAGSVVTKDVPPNALAAGNPAVVKKIYE